MVGPVAPRTSSRIANAGFIAALLVVFIHIDIPSSCPRYVSWTVDIIETMLCGLVLLAIGAVGKVADLTLICSYGSILGVPLLMLFLCGVIPSALWPRWLTGCAFPVFLLHVFALGLYNNFFSREVNGLFALLVKYAFAVVLPIVVTVAAKRCFPRLTALAFGGRG